MSVMNSLVFYITNVILFVSVAFMVYFLIRKTINQSYYLRVKDSIQLVNEEYQKALLVRKQKQRMLKIKKNMDIFYRLYVLIDKTGAKSSKIFWFLNPHIIILLCFCSAIIVYALFQDVFKVMSVSLIMSVLGLLIPLIVLSLVAQKKEEDIEKILSNFMLQLKNQTRIKNDIIEAFRAVQPNCIEPLRTFVKQFLVEIQSGVKDEEAFENFKDKINIERFKLFIANVQYCHTYGGNFTELLDKTQKIIVEIQSEKRKRIRETRSARLVLVVMVIIDLYLYFSFIKVHPEYMNIMKNTFFGQLILNFNFLSIWILLWIGYSIKKLDY